MTENLNPLFRGTDTVLPEGDLEGRLAEGRPLRVKLGMDPTAPAVTLGWTVVLRKLRQFQEAGHTAVLIVGDFTAQVFKITSDPKSMAPGQTLFNVGSWPRSRDPLYGLIVAVDSEGRVVWYYKSNDHAAVDVRLASNGNLLVVDNGILAGRALEIY